MLHELDSRTRDDGLEVCLLWDDEDDVVVLRVRGEDPANLIPFTDVCKVPKEKAAHAFRFPGLYTSQTKRAELHSVKAGGGDG